MSGNQVERRKPRSGPIEIDSLVPLPFQEDNEGGRFTSKINFDAMAAEIEMDWPGQSGSKYRYYGYPLGTDMREVPANYIYAKRDAQGYWVPVYIGECGNLKERCINHHKMDCIIRNGATHIFTHVSSEIQQARLDEETDLRARFNTSCNDQ